MSKRAVRSKGGKRKDLNNQYFRSAMEANYARYLNFLVERQQIKKWEYEADEFYFPIKRGTRFYTPDFKVWENNGRINYFETKGWMDAKSKTQLNRMEKYHPEINVIVIERKQYMDIWRKMAKIIPNWEGDNA